MMNIYRISTVTLFLPGCSAATIRLIRRTNNKAQVLVATTHMSPAYRILQTFFMLFVALMQLDRKLSRIISIITRLYELAFKNNTFFLSKAATGTMFCRKLKLQLETMMSMCVSIICKTSPNINKPFFIIFFIIFLLRTACIFIIASASNRFNQHGPLHNFNWIAANFQNDLFVVILTLDQRILAMGSMQLSNTATQIDRHRIF